MQKNNIALLNEVLNKLGAVYLDDIVSRTLKASEMPLMKFAIDSENVDIIMLLINTKQVQLIDNEGESLFLYAQEKGMANVAIRILKEMNVRAIEALTLEKQKIALTLALDNNQYALVNTLSKHTVTLLREDDALNARVKQNLLSYCAGNRICQALHRYKAKSAEAPDRGLSSLTVR